MLYGYVNSVLLFANDDLRRLTEHKNVILFGSLITLTKAEATHSICIFALFYLLCLLNKYVNFNVIFLTSFKLQTLMHWRNMQTHPKYIRL